MTNALSTIDDAVLAAIGEYPAFVTFRQGLRGSSGSGENINTGLTPVLLADGTYDVAGRRLPALFISRTLIQPEETEEIHYSVELILILPEVIEGAKITGNQIQEAADLILQAGQLTNDINRTSIAGRLQTAGMSQCAKYTFEKLAYGGNDIQPQVVARIRFLVPFRALTGSSLGVRHG